MLEFFPEPYEDELLYSTIARYHYYSGNISMRETLVQVFGDSSALPSVTIPCRLGYFANQFRHEAYTAKYFIANHTLLPFYLPFMTQERKRQVLAATEGNGGKKLYMLIGMTAGGICRKSELYYCPQCANEDVKQFGEAFFHRLHQLEGVLVCEKHNCILKTYPVIKNKTSRIRFIRFDSNKGIQNTRIDEVQKYCDNDIHLIGQLNAIALAARYIINHDLSDYDYSKVHENINLCLANKGYLTSKGQVRQREFCSDLYTYYGEQLLTLLECNFDPVAEYAWPREAVRKSSKSTHPLRYILIALFLCGGVEGLFTYKQAQHPTAEEYSKSRRIKYGEEWQKRLISVLKLGGSLRGIARVMDCDPKTIVKHARFLGMDAQLNSNMKVYVPNGKFHKDYSEDLFVISKYVKENQNCTRNEVRKYFGSQYMRLYKHQRELLYSILPKRIKQQTNRKLKVDWEARDRQILEKVKMAYSRLLFMSKPTRISFSRLEKDIGYSSLHFYLEKLPMTKQFIEKIVESVESFQLRRVNYICNKLHEEKGNFEKWEVMRLAGLKKTTTQKIVAQIDLNIKKLCSDNMGEKDEQDRYQRMAISGTS